eukprot:731729-Rhodomonas_salina.2
MVSSRVSLVFAIVAIFALIATAVPLTSNQFASLLAACKATGWNGAHADCATINTWDTSQITDMSSLFRDERTFNLNIGAWNTGSVTDMSNMFYGAFAFNQDISGWDVSSVTSMQQMFMRPSVINSDSQFNQPLSSWDVSKVLPSPTSSPVVLQTPAHLPLLASLLFRFGSPFTLHLRQFLPLPSRLSTFRSPACRCRKDCVRAIQTQQLCTWTSAV